MVRILLAILCLVFRCTRVPLRSFCVNLAFLRSKRPAWPYLSGWPVDVWGGIWRRAGGVGYGVW